MAYTKPNNHLERYSQHVLFKIKPLILKFILEIQKFSSTCTDKS